MSEDFFDVVSDFLRSRGQTVKDQVYRTYSELIDRSLTLRLALIVGGYLLIRPYVERVFEWGMRRKMAKEEAAKKEKRQTKQALVAAGAPLDKTNPNTLRYGHLKDKVDVSDDTDSDDGDATQPGRVLSAEERSDQKARRRHRRVLRAKLDEDELQQLVEDDWNEPDLEDLLAPKRG